jgi:hypothetical protein
MQYVRIGDYLATSHVTGPRHNRLQLRLARGSQTQPICEQLPPIGACKHAPLDEVALIRNVLEGVSRANLRGNSDYCVTHIRYVENDTGPVVVFALLASRIVEHLSSGGTFIEQANTSGSPFFSGAS